MDKTQKDNLVVDDNTLYYIYCFSNHIIHLNLKKLLDRFTNNMYIE